MYERNRSFQESVDDKHIKEAGAVIGFDTSSWISSERAKHLNKPYFLDQSIAHPREKDSIFSKLRQRYPQWAEDIPAKEHFMVQLEEAEYALAHRIVVASSFTKNSLIKNGIAKDRIILNPYGVGGDFFRDRPIKKREQKARFVYLGFLGARKGLPFLIETWMEHQLYNNSELWLAGPATDFAKAAIGSTPGMT